MRRILGVGLALLVGGLGLLIPSTANAAPGAPFKLPYRAGSAYTITGSPGNGFSHADDYNRHAVDFGMPTGTPIVASAAGRVYFAGPLSGGYGIMVLVDHGNNKCTQYAHLSATTVRTGQSVKQGQQIARSGNTGNSTGPHLHWNVVYCNSHISREIPNSVERGTSYPTGVAPVSQNRLVTKPGLDNERISDFSGDGHADILAVDAAGKFWYYPNNGNKISSTTKRQIGSSWHTWKYVMSADYSGDGSADVLGVDSSGKLWYYPNNGNQISSATKKQLGHGWGKFIHVTAADWNNDGRADMIAVDSAGKMWVYPQKNGKISSTTKKQIGSSWHTWKHVTAADWNKDGYADIIGVSSSGKLMLYPQKNGKISSTTKKQIGSSWHTWDRVFASDFTGDGHADIIGVNASGNLWLYPQKSGKISSTTKKQLGHGWGKFVHVM